MTEADGPSLRIRVHLSGREDGLATDYTENFDRSRAGAVAADLTVYCQQQATTLGSGIEVDLVENKVKIKHPEGRMFDVTVFGEDVFDAWYWPLPEESTLADQPASESYAGLSREEFAYFLNQFLRSGRIIREDDPEADASEPAGDGSAA